MIAPTRILVTGGAGFIGAHLVRRCVDDGHDVHVVLRPSSDASRLENLGSAVTRHRLSLCNVSALRACLAQARPSHIFHLTGDTASRHDHAIERSARSIGCMADLLALIQSAAELETPPRFFLRTGSIAEYGTGPLPFREEQREQPETTYAAAIVAGTHFAQAVASHLPFPLITVRLALVYGPGQAEDFLVPSLVASCLEGRAITLHRPLDQRDLLHVHDAAGALLQLAELPLSGGIVVNVGSGKAVGVARLADRIAALAAADPGLIRRLAQADPAIHALSIEKIHALIGWKPQIGLAEGLRALIEDTRRVGRAVAA